MLTYIIVFAVAGAFYWGLRRLGKRLQHPGPVQPGEAGPENTDLADNLEFAIDVATRKSRRDRRDDTTDPGDSGGDGGGGGDGG